jgi:hypothetical protein
MNRLDCCRRHLALKGSKGGTIGMPWRDLPLSSMLANSASTSRQSAHFWSLRDNPDQSCGAVDRIAKARLAEVEERIVSLNALRAELQRMVEECASGRVAECRVIETLADSSHGHGRLAET